MSCIIIMHPRQEPMLWDTPDVLSGDNDFRTLQTIIGGYIEVVHPDGFPQDVILICNEEGKLRDLPFNFYIEICQYPDAICGTAVFCAEGIVDGEPDLVPLTYSQAESVARALRSTI